MLTDSWRVAYSSHKYGITYIERVCVKTYLVEQDCADTEIPDHAKPTKMRLNFMINSATTTACDRRGLEAGPLQNDTLSLYIFHRSEWRFSYQLELSKTATTISTLPQKILRQCLCCSTSEVDMFWATSIFHNPDLKRR